MLNEILLIVERLRNKTSLSLNDNKIMKDPNNKHECNRYLNKFFNIAKYGKELEIIRSCDIQSKCVLIENKALSIQARVSI